MTAGIIVGIDPGHGASSAGAEAAGLVEKDLNLACALRLEAALMGTPVVPVLTRRGDINPSWAARAEAVAGARFGISIHFNANSDETVCNAEGYHLPGDDLARQICLAGVHGMPIELASTKLFETSAAGWKSRAHRVVSAFAPIPWALIEVAYLTNFGDRAFLKTGYALDEIVCGLRAAVMRGAQIVGG